MRPILRLATTAALALCGALHSLAAQPPQGPRPPQGPPGDPFAGAFFPPELVMQHQGEIALGAAERQTIQQAIQQAQTRFGDVQWKLSAEAERLGRLVRGESVDEAQVLEQVDRVLSLEREMKRTQIALLVRIKNALTPAQQAKLAALQAGRQE
jgi:Spy/CpxP family protein refolding chaperone